MKRRYPEVKTFTTAHMCGSARDWRALRIPKRDHHGGGVRGGAASDRNEDVEVRGAALKQARGDDAAELALLESELQAAAVMLVNIPTRMLFEQALFEDRAKGPLDPAVLCDRMEALQREWYGPALGEPNRFFWAAKLHFYLQRPFYNYPYTFGYLFSSLIHARAMEVGPSWAPSYTALLRETGAGPAEGVAERHLGVDLRTKDAWMPILRDLEAKVARYEVLLGR